MTKLKLAGTYGHHGPTEIKMPTMQRINAHHTLTRTAVLSYYSTNDPAHRICHADRVCDSAINILTATRSYTNLLGIADTPEEVIKLAITAAYSHDMFADHRDIHHTLAQEYVMSTNAVHLEYLTRPQRIIVANACNEHRASFKGTYTSFLSELLSAADRGKPDYFSYLKRAVQYAESEGEESLPALERSIIHLLDKYGTDGYARYPEIYTKLYSAEIKLMASQAAKYNAMIGLIPLNSIRAIIEQDCVIN